MILKLIDFPWRKVYDEGTGDEEIARMVRMVASPFQPFLGPCSMEKEKKVKYHAMNSELSWTEPQWIITYHPQDHPKQQDVRLRHNKEN